MEDGNLLALKTDEDSMSGNAATEMVPLDQMKMDAEEPIVDRKTDDEVWHLKEFDMVFRDEERKENEIEEVSNEEGSKEEVKDDENPKVEMSFEEDSEEGVKNDENPKVEVSSEEDSEEGLKNDENPKVWGSFEEDLEEEMKNDENPKEEVIIEDGLEEEVKNDENPKEEVKNEAKKERKSGAISKNEVSKFRKRPKLLQKKKMALRKKGKTAFLSTSKLGKGGLVGGVDTGVATCKPVKLNGEESNMVLGVKDKVKSPKIFGDEEKKEHEIGEVSNEEHREQEEQNEGDTRNETKAKEKLEASSKKKVNKFRNICKNKKNALRGKNEVAVKNRENPEYSKWKTTMKGECTGLIFMCSSKTKNDCYHYQVLGLPARKRDIVFDIYEGMKLFLFDYDLRLMYGIYEAAGPGGYNIEPKAFKSAFPSQVRFTVLEDCSPLAEEKFKNLIRDNYYSRNKFHCQLNSKQVKNLCELFSVASKGSTSKWLQGSRKAEAPTLVDYVPKRTHRSRKAENPQAEAPAFVDSKSKRPPRSRTTESLHAEAPTFLGHGCKRPRGSQKAENRQTEAPTFVGCESKRPCRSRNAESRQSEASTSVGRKSKRRRRSRKAKTHTFVDPNAKRLHQIPRAETQEFLYRDSRHHRWEDERHNFFTRDCLFSKDLVTYRMEVYESPVQDPSLCQPLHLRLGSALLPSSERDDCRMDKLQYRDLQPLDVELRRRYEFERRDSYTIPRRQDNFDHCGSYIASRYHHDPSSSAGHQSEYYPLTSRGPASESYLSAGPPPHYPPY